MSLLQNTLYILCAGSLVACGEPDVLDVRPSEASVIGRTIYVGTSEGWISLKALLGYPVDHVTLVTSGPFTLLDYSAEDWRIRCDGAGTGRIRVEERFVSPAKEYTVQCSHGQGGG